MISSSLLLYNFRFFFFNVTATTEIYTLSLHDALPISRHGPVAAVDEPGGGEGLARGLGRDRKSTRLNSSHPSISYAVFCLKKKKKYRIGRNSLFEHDNKNVYCRSCSSWISAITIYHI